MSFLQKIYWKSPYSIKCFMAYLNAYREDIKRHGKIFEKACEQIRSRNHWTQEQFRNYQESELKKILLHASVNIPYYRNFYKNPKIFARNCFFP